MPAPTPPPPAASGASALLRPLKIGELELAGRVFRSAMAETRASAQGGFVTDELIELYEPIARGGTPLIITGNLAITAASAGLYRETHIDDDDKLPGLRELVDTIHGHRSRVFAQINHCGRQVITQPDPVAPSAVSEKTLGTRPRAMTVPEIAEAVDDFAAAAERAQRAGFDGVQLHAAHGYLLSEFLTPYTNRRTDDYGGSADRRLRFPREVVRAVRERVGPGFPVIAKLNGHDLLLGRDGLDTAGLVAAARALEQEGLDAVEVSCAHYESGMLTARGRFVTMFREMARGQFKDLSPARRRLMKLTWPLMGAYGNLAWPYREGYNLAYARQFTGALSIPVICVGGWQHRAQIERAIESGGCDAVSAARGFLADPLLFRHLVEDGDPRPACSYCNACLGRLGHMPLDCYDPAVRPRRDAMLREELGWPAR